MEPVFRVGQKVAVNIGANPANRTEGVITAIHPRPELITYRVRFPSYPREAGIDTVYMAEYLTPLD